MLEKPEKLDNKRVDFKTFGHLNWPSPLISLKRLGEGPNRHRVRYKKAYEKLQVNHRAPPQTRRTALTRGGGFAEYFRAGSAFLQGDSVGYKAKENKFLLPPPEAGP